MTYAPSGSPKTKILHFGETYHSDISETISVGANPTLDREPSLIIDREMNIG
jgi:hypothetical protein